MSPGVLSARHALAALAALALCGCSSGDDEATRDIELSASNLSFVAASPSAAAPVSQVISVSLSEGVQNVTALKSGSAIASVAVTFEGTSARVTVTPAAPTSLGAGDYTGSLVISAYFCGDSACSRLEAGPSRTANVAYFVPPIVTDVAPSTAISGTSASIVLRGSGFNAFSPGVSFGTTAATTVTVVSDTEIQATYPALAAGTYPIALTVASHSDPVVSEARLAVVDPLPFPAQALAWPTPPTRIHSLEYDAQRRALYAATDADGGLLVRYAYSDGAWQTASVAIASLRDAGLTTDGQQLLTISDTSATVVNPVDLALGSAIQAPSLPTGSYLSSLAFLNTNQAIVTTATGTNTATP